MNSLPYSSQSLIRGFAEMQFLNVQFWPMFFSVRYPVVFPVRYPAVAGEAGNPQAGLEPAAALRVDGSPSLEAR